MTDSSEMRDLAGRLAAYEATAGNASGPAATLRVYEKLRQSLGDFAGFAAFQSLAARALVLARLEAPGLATAQVAADGSLKGLGGLEPENDTDKDQAGAEERLGEGAVILIARLLGLLRIFLGEALTLRLLRDAWPGVALGESNSGNGRKA